MITQGHDALFGDGYAYTYVYPGLQKVVQAAGRVIRSETDVGVIALLIAVLPRFVWVGIAGVVLLLLIGFFLPGDSLLFTAGFLASQGLRRQDIRLGLERRTRALFTWPVAQLTANQPDEEPECENSAAAHRLRAHLMGFRAGDAAEDGFVYFSDAFIRELK